MWKLKNIKIQMYIIKKKHTDTENKLVDIPVERGKGKDMVMGLRGTNSYI